MTKTMSTFVRAGVTSKWASLCGTLVCGGLMFSAQAFGAAPARSARTAPATSQQPAGTEPQVQVLRVKGNVYLFAGGSNGNTAVQIGEDGVLVVDTQSPVMAEKIVAAIRSLSDRPIRYVVNTSSGAARVGGNATIASQGASLGGANVVGLLGNQAIQGAKIMAHDNVLSYMSMAHGRTPAAPTDAWPTDTYVVPFQDLYFNDENVRLIHVPNAYSSGDSIVHFRGSDVLAMGALFSTVRYPVIDHERGGNINGIIEGLNTALDIAVPKWEEEGGTMIIPGEGRITDELELLEYRDMLVIIRARIKDLIAKGRTLEQVKAARPTLDYDPRFGADSGAWTTAQFIEAVYRDESQAK